MSINNRTDQQDFVPFFNDPYKSKTFKAFKGICGLAVTGLVVGGLLSIPGINLAIIIGVAVVGIAASVTFALCSKEDLKDFWNTKIVRDHAPPFGSYHPEIPD